MKKLLVVLAVFGALALWAAPAHAQVPPITGSGWQAHFNNCSTDFVPISDDTTTWIPRLPLGASPTTGFAPTTVAVGDENRSIFDVNEFLNKNGPYALIPDGVLTGLSYDLELAQIIGDPVAGTATLNYVALGRNPITDPTGTGPVGEGGVLEIYSHSTSQAFSTIASASPTAWQMATDTSVPNHAVGADAFPGINTASDGASLYLQGEFCPIGTITGDPGFNGDAILLQETIYLGSGGDQDTGAAVTAFIHITGGSAAGDFSPNAFGPGEDLSLADTFVLPGATGYTDTAADSGMWAVASSDPVRGTVAIIPEPATMSLLGLGIAALAARIRRKK